MQHFRLTGGGLLGVINRHKKGLACITCSAFLLGAYSMASADDMETYKLQHAPTESVQTSTKTVEYIPLSVETAEELPQTSYTHEIDIMLEELCQKYGVDDVLAIAIARLETGHYTSALFTDNNNFGGMGDGTRYYSYSDKNEGAEQFVKMLKKYAENGKNTPQTMAGTYCPDNPSWAKLVETMMGEIEDVYSR